MDVPLDTNLDDTTTFIKVMITRYLVSFIYSFASPFLLLFPALIQNTHTQAFVIFFLSWSYPTSSPLNLHISSDSQPQLTAVQFILKLGSRPVICVPVTGGKG